MYEDPSGFVEWAVQIAVGLFALFLLLCIALWVIDLGIVRPVRWARGRRESVHHELARALPLEPLSDPRAALAAEIGRSGLVAKLLAERLRVRAREVIRRDPGDMGPAGKELAALVFDRWAQAGGRVPRLRRELPQESWRFPYEPAKFVQEWNESTWLHSAQHPKLRLETLAAGPFMTGAEFLEWQIDVWAMELEREVSLNCCDLGCVPFLVLAPLALALENVLPLWVAVPLALLVVVPFMLGWRWLRRRAYVRLGDD